MRGNVDNFNKWEFAAIKKEKYDRQEISMENIILEELLKLNALPHLNLQML